MSTVDELLEDWQEDAVFKPDTIEETYKIPRLHSKYYNKLSKVRRAQKKLQNLYEEIELKQSMYYLGRANAEIYREKPFNHTITKSELPLWLRADPELSILRKRLDILIELREVLEEIVRQINVRNFHLRNIHDGMKFAMGG